MSRILSGILQATSISTTETSARPNPHDCSQAQSRRTVQRPASAAAHLTGTDRTGILDTDWWLREAPPNWAEIIGSDRPDAALSLRRCTYSGRPFGNEAFVDELSRRFGRYWTRGRPPKRRSAAGGAPDQYSSTAGRGPRHGPRALWTGSEHEPQ